MAKKLHLDKKIYNNTLNLLKEYIQNARVKAIHSVNKKLIQLYWIMGKTIVEKQKEYGWGRSIVERLAKDLQKNFSGTSGYSAQNLWYMRKFYLEYADRPVLQQLVGEIPWGHNVLIFSKIKDVRAREYYLRASHEMGWSRTVLLNQIKANAYERSQKEKQHNFKKSLPVHLHEQADEAIKSSYNLEFLGINRPILERELEHKLITRLKDFIMELGKGFTFIANQYRLTLGKKAYFIDLLFFNRQLQCLVAL